MPVKYTIIGFSNYIIIDKVLYRETYKTKSKSCVWQYRNKREIKRTFNKGVEGYVLVKNKTRKFYSLKKLQHKLKKIQ